MDDIYVLYRNIVEDATFLGTNPQAATTQGATSTQTYWLVFFIAENSVEPRKVLPFPRLEKYL